MFFSCIYWTSEFLKMGHSVLKYNCPFEYSSISIYISMIGMILLIQNQNVWTCLNPAETTSPSWSSAIHDKMVALRAINFLDCCRSPFTGIRQGKQRSALIALLCLHSQHLHHDHGNLVHTLQTPTLCRLTFPIKSAITLLVCSEWCLIIVLRAMPFYKVGGLPLNRRAWDGNVGTEKRNFLKIYLFSYHSQRN